MNTDISVDDFLIRTVRRVEDRFPALRGVIVSAATAAFILWNFAVAVFVGVSVVSGMVVVATIWSVGGDVHQVVVAVHELTSAILQTAATGQKAFLSELAEVFVGAVFVIAGFYVVSVEGARRNWVRSLLAKPAKPVEVDGGAS